MWSTQKRAKAVIPAAPEPKSKEHAVTFTLTWLKKESYRGVMLAPYPPPQTLSHSPTPESFKECDGIASEFHLVHYEL